MEEIPLEIIFENNDGEGVQYRKHSIVINTRRDTSFNKVYKQALDKMTASIASKVELQIEEITQNAKTDITEEIQFAFKEIEANRCAESTEIT